MSSEQDTEAETYVALSVDVSRQRLCAVGGIAVIGGYVESPVLFPVRIDFQADFRRCIEAPALVVETSRAEIGRIPGEHGT